MKNQRVLDIGKYYCTKDIHSVENFAENINNFKSGYVILLTNDQSYWTEPKNSEAGYADFSVHDGAVKAVRLK